MTTLVDRLIAVHGGLSAAQIPHAFGGALALAWCTNRARGTIDLDINVFVPTDKAEAVIAALPPETRCSDEDRRAIEQDGQVRLWSDQTPIDLFFNTTDFHEQVSTRVRWEPFGGMDIPFLSCRDIAVFKTFCNRTRDWADLEDMAAAGTLDTESVLGVVAAYLGDDERIERLRGLAP
jgi:hypothetical protein